jgi:outer membrane protein assembly factor BamB
MIATMPSPIPSVPAPEWTTTNKEAGRVDALLPDRDRCLVGGNFSQPKPWLFAARGGDVGPLAATGVKGRVYDIAFNLPTKTLHVVGFGGYDTHTTAWTHMNGTYRSVGLTVDGFAVIGAENGQVIRLGSWGTGTPGSARDLVVTEDAVFVANAVSNSKGALTKLDVETGRALWQNVTYPTLDLALSPDGTTIYAALGGPGGTVSAYDAVTGQRKWFHMTDGNCQAICTLFDGTVIVGMHGDYVASLVNKTIKESGTGGRVPRKKVFALDPNGNLLDWQVSLTSTAGVLGVWALASSPTMLYVGGDFTHVNGVEHPRLTCFEVS